ncbi:4-aminobutyrate--2-oxoglutarate transaminase [Solimicrobium silvestre]|uniref:GABAtrnsam: 4-aminobutyrate transaminase n=1 Tax=Solimicrobium silvestre TaxID=2099400 RepID=A0A2S9GZQ5_9BURK|nr:4-aminobutyrate--2-oxoglutarate transaminase [Solimicrobium silvestre]PRC93211.1 GABAtrnsam: 4-aminobutyrate transaminase [Solimicrobium silvestre]
MNSNQEWKSRKDAATPRGVGVMCNFYAARAENSEIWDIEGKRYIDFASGIAVVNTGHRHPKIVAAIQQQLEHFTHTAYQIVPYGSYVELAEKINQLTPGKHAKKTAFFTTGAEAVENAIKIARSATKRPGVIAFSGAFHGRTSMGMALTGKVDPYKIGFGPFPGEVYHAPFPSELHGMSVEGALSALQTLFKTDIEPAKVAAIIIEPIQGEGGFCVTPVAFMQALRAICDQHGILLIADEIQTGFARTGKLFAMEHYGVIPDLMTIAKSLAGGMPLSGVCGKADIMDAPAPGGLGGTYAGNALAVAAALAVLDIIDDEKLIERANQLGQRLTNQLHTTMQDQGVKSRVAEVRGLGSMIAIEFKHPESGKPDADFTKKVQAYALDKGLLLLSCGVYGNVIRFLYPLTITDALMTEALGILDAALRAN